MHHRIARSKIGLRSLRPLPRCGFGEFGHRCQPRCQAASDTMWSLRMKRPSVSCAVLSVPSVARLKVKISLILLVCFLASHMYVCGSQLSLLLRPLLHVLLWLGINCLVETVWLGLDRKVGICTIEAAPGPITPRALQIFKPGHWGTVLQAQGRARAVVLNARFATPHRKQRIA